MKMTFTTIDWQNNSAIILDQTRLPAEEKYVKILDYREMAEAIKQLKVRGAPAIGIAAAFGVCLGANEIVTTNSKEFKKQLNIIFKSLAKTRPTAVNLFWALRRMIAVVEANHNCLPRELKMLLIKEALAIFEEDKIICAKMSELGASLINDGDIILTHCNAGALATGGIGTAIGAIVTAFQQGKKIKVFADETRPLLQGARLTMWELKKAGLTATLICDNMAGYVMKQGLVNCVMLGADRIAANGDIANKIGTYALAVLANHHHIPFYVIAPTTTFDLSVACGEEIPIEQRSPDEITNYLGKQIAPPQIDVYNPAFDITPHHLITAIVTENKICYPPFQFVKKNQKQKNSLT